MEKKSTSYFEEITNKEAIGYSRAVAMIGETVDDPYLAENHPDALKFLNKFQSYLAAAGYEIYEPAKELVINPEPTPEEAEEQPAEADQPAEEQPVEETEPKKRRRRRSKAEE